MAWLTEEKNKACKSGRKTQVKSHFYIYKKFLDERCGISLLQLAILRKVRFEICHNKPRPAILCLLESIWTHHDSIFHPAIVTHSEILQLIFTSYFTLYLNFLLLAINFTSGICKTFWKFGGI